MNNLMYLFIIIATIFSLSCSQKEQYSLQEPEQYEDMELQWLMDLARSDTRQARARLVDQNMNLTEQQKTVFWPIFNDYQQEFIKIGDERLSILTDYAENIDLMTDEKANELAKRAIDNRMNRLELMKKYYNKMSRELGSVVATRFLQVENVINLIVDLQIASDVPLME